MSDGEALLGLRRVQGEQLLELVHDEERVAVTRPASASRPTARAPVSPVCVELREPLEKVPIASVSPASSGVERSREAERRVRARGDVDALPIPRAATEPHPRAGRTSCPHAGGPDHREKRCGRGCLSHSAWTSSSRPKKTAASFSVKD